MTKKSDYDKLRKVWYEKLKKSGFEDIESDDYNLKEWSSRFASKRSMRSWEAKASYYQMASSFLESYEFDTELDKVIWNYHAEGISIRDITILLRKTKIKRTNRDFVDKVIQRLVVIMKHWDR